MVLMGVFGYPHHDGTVSFAPRSTIIARRALPPFLGLFKFGGCCRERRFGTFQELYRKTNITIVIASLENPI